MIKFDSRNKNVEEVKIFFLHGIYKFTCTVAAAAVPHLIVSNFLTIFVIILIEMLALCIKDT